MLRTGTNYAHYTDGSRVRAFMTMDRRADGFDTRRSSFIGPYGSESAPQAMEELACGNTENAFEPSVLALQSDLDLPAGASCVLRVLTGFHDQPGAIASIKSACFGETRGASPAPRPDGADGGRCGGPGGWEIEVPDADFSRFANTWLQHQLRFNASWARVYYNGYRDLCQDLAGMASIDPAWAWERFREVLAHQYANGFAPRAWIGRDLVEQGYSDSPVWIATTVRALIEALEKPDLLDEPLPFVDGDEEGTVFEHLKRSLDHLWADRGRHGLSKIHRGDWNDLMNAVGWGGEGESVWLTLALVVALQDGACVAGLYGKSQYQKEWLEWADELRRLVRKHALADGFFLRAFTDAGRPVGAADSDEGLFLIPQAWAVLAGVVTDAEARDLLARVEDRLERPQGLLTLERGFADFLPDIGFLSTVRPGCNVNAGFYQHAAAFHIMACLRAGRPDDAWRLTRKILPYPEERGVLTGEPFVLNNAYYGPAAGYRQGHSDTGWITGTAGWLVRIIHDGFFGVSVRDGRRLARPVLPGAWEGASNRWRGSSTVLPGRP